MADKTKLNGASTIVREEDLEDMTSLERELSDRIDTAQKDGRAYMMAQYVRMLAMIKSEAKRLRARFDRDTLAAIRREYKDIRAQQRDAAQKDAT